MMMPASQSNHPLPISIIACGALAHEIVALQALNGWNHIIGLNLRILKKNG